MPLPTLSDDALAELDVFLHRIETVEDLHRQGMLTEADAAAGAAAYLEQAGEIAGTALSRGDLEAARAIGEAGLFAGWLDLIDIAWIAVAALLLVSLVWLSKLYVVPLIKRMPRWVHEVLAWSACAALVVAPAHLLTGGGMIAVASVGCVGMCGALLLTFDVHLRRWKEAHAIRAYGLILCGIWAGVAVVYGSALIGGLAVLAWLWSAGAILLLSGTFFSRDDAVWVGMLAALSLLLPALGLTLTQTAPPPALAVFVPGALALCGTVYLSGCLMLASRHYPQSDDRFFATQLLAVGSATVAIALGTVAGLDHLAEAGGTFFALYLLEKFFEIPWKKTGYAWMCLALSGLLYAGAAFAEQHPGLFFGL